MNSFWIPQLGGQEYAMPGMAMGLWLQADKPGHYDGYGANFTGSGFAHMSFKVNSMSQKNFSAWVNQIKETNHPLTETGFNTLAKPGTVGKLSYSSYPSGLFKEIVNHSSGYNSDKSGSSSMQGMGMNTLSNGTADSQSNTTQNSNQNKTN